MPALSTVTAPPELLKPPFANSVSNETSILPEFLNNPPTSAIMPPLTRTVPELLNAPPTSHPPRGKFMDPVREKKPLLLKFPPIPAKLVGPTPRLPIFLKSPVVLRLDAKPPTTMLPELIIELAPRLPTSLITDTSPLLMNLPDTPNESPTSPNSPPTLIELLFPKFPFTAMPLPLLMIIVPLLAAGPCPAALITMPAPSPVTLTPPLFVNPPLFGVIVKILASTSALMLPLFTRVRLLMLPHPVMLLTLLSVSSPNPPVTIAPDRFIVPPPDSVAV